jgi:2-amino-4-hydroxy-6-hydroxymethyldihydropteridine diphosphokinase
VVVTELLAIVGLGSNLGDRRATILAAVARLGAHDAITVEAVSPLYESDAVGPPQPAFLNAAVRVRTMLEPEALLDELLAMELAFGRVRAVRWGPRTLDLDLLWAAGPPVRTARLEIPHPHLHERPFALAPLLDVLPEASPALSARLCALGGPPKRHAGK